MCDEEDSRGRCGFRMYKRSILGGQNGNPGLSLGGRAYDVSPDGERFLMLKEDASSQDTSTEPYFIVVQNWFEELRRLVPTE